MKIKLAKKDWERIKKHLLIDLSYGAEGTFNKLTAIDNIYDEKEAIKVTKILQEISKQFNKQL